MGHWNIAIDTTWKSLGMMQLLYGYPGFDALCFWAMMQASLDKHA
jgi:hypothetical protein